MLEAELPRKLKLFSLTSIVVGDMIGAGIFTTSGLLLAQLHDPLLLLLLWVIGGAIALSGALSYGELGAKFPNSGGGKLCFSNQTLFPPCRIFERMGILFCRFFCPCSSFFAGFQ